MTQYDWPRLLDDLRWLLGEQDFAFPHVRHPVGRPALAKAIGYSSSTVRNWMDGAEPKHSDGEALLAKWCSLSGKQREFAPITKKMCTAAKIR